MMIGRTGTPQMQAPVAPGNAASVRALVPIAGRQSNRAGDRGRGHDGGLNIGSQYDNQPTLHQGASTHRAAFLTHLLATRDGAPQTRQRRRAEPAEAATVYKTALVTLSRTAPTHRTIVA
jgi:hypothetical protein